MGQNGQGNALLALAPLLLPLLLIAWLVYAGRRRQSAAAEFQASLRVGDRVCTTSGLFGTVVGLDDSAAQLEVAPGVVLRFDRRAIGQVVDDAGTAPLSDSPQAGTTDRLEKDEDI